MKDIIEKIKSITQVSYEQEIARSKAILTKSDYLIKYITSTFVFMNAALVFLATSKLVSPWILVIVYMISGVVLCYSLYKALKVQILLKGLFFPTGKTIMKDISKQLNENSERITPLELDRDIILYYSNYTEELENSNNNRAKILNSAYKWYLSSIILITMHFFIILIIIA
ncbi:hypothetical protein [uncultured Clostridium sp.]|uniref:hypothetical protein n=1 Tax=uncultured Clostridium sp. TaxID=59620 RepID=UPI00258BE51F|nr:hypothetical protein [uncultured Clostridium sp.]